MWNDIPSLALLFALLIDLWLGEPAASWHPVVWMGYYLDFTSKHFAPLCNSPPVKSNTLIFISGAVSWCIGAALCVTIAAVLTWALVQLPSWAAIMGFALILKPLFAWAMLRREILAVEAALVASLEAGRQRLSWLCSRDVSQLDESQVREAAIETLAENLNDSVIAPLFWFVLLGLPGAILYRFANTADAMWGYIGVHAGRDWTWAGKWAAHADDVLSWLPARLTAILLALAAGSLSIRTLSREAMKTPSPNSGWPMAAMALALDVYLSKSSVYYLHKQGRSPQSTDMTRALQLSSRVVWMMALLGFLAIQYERGWA